MFLTPASQNNQFPNLYFNKSLWCLLSRRNKYSRITLQRHFMGPEKKCR